MIMSFTLDPDVVSGYRTAQAVRSVLNRMGGFNNQGDFTYHGQTGDGGITEHRIREIQERGDLGSTYTNAYWYFSHHTSAAVSELDSYLDQWDFMAKHLGNEDVFKRVGGLMARTGQRIYPACFAIHEADIDEQAQKSYREMCDRWMEQCTNQSRFYQGQKQVASRSRKHAVRQVEVAAAKETLNGFRVDLAAWVNEVNAQIQ